MSKNSFRKQSVSDAASLERSFEPALQKLKGKNLPANEVRAYVESSQDFDFLEKDYLRYVAVRQEIEAMRARGQSWASIYETINKQEMWALEAFLDAMESEHQVQITDANQLAQISGIEDKEALSLLLTIGRESKYLRALRKAVEEGAMFSDLLQLEPSAFKLPETWEGATGREADKRTSILWAIGEGYAVSFLAYTRVSPHLRSIAADLNAPYSTVIDAFQAFHERRRTLQPN